MFIFSSEGDNVKIKEIDLSVNIHLYEYFCDEYDVSKLIYTYTVYTFEWMTNHMGPKIVNVRFLLA